MSPPLHSVRTVIRAHLIDSTKWLKISTIILMHLIFYCALYDIREIRQKV
ncbi:12153_t:CDS:2 [Ambispora leptoticha]|uniref:12153_t:CDS:1 n=1 Tax=Ambispora leptoticha TaxID=144679 RepID=A0A9N9F9W3_9GLOM|nr:12153_t:CDS:2 [Ambispora leptoticha]